MNELFTDMGGNFNFQAQDSFLEYFFLRFGDLKNESPFLKKTAEFVNLPLILQVGLQF